MFAFVSQLILAYLILVAYLLENGTFVIAQVVLAGVAAIGVMLMCRCAGVGTLWLSVALVISVILCVVPENGESFDTKWTQYVACVAFYLLLIAICLQYHKHCQINS
jgi:hypothetical protein